MEASGEFLHHKHSSHQRAVKAPRQAGASADCHQALGAEFGQQAGEALPQAVGHCRAQLHDWALAAEGHQGKAGRRPEAEPRHGGEGCHQSGGLLWILEALNGLGYARARTPGPGAGLKPKQRWHHQHRRQGDRQALQRPGPAGKVGQALQQQLLGVIHQIQGPASQAHQQP